MITKFSVNQDRAIKACFRENGCFRNSVADKVALAYQFVGLLFASRTGICFKASHGFWASLVGVQSFFEVGSPENLRFTDHFTFASRATVMLRENGEHENSIAIEITLYGGSEDRRYYFSSDGQKIRFAGWSRLPAKVA